MDFPLSALLEILPHTFPLIKNSTLCRLPYLSPEHFLDFQDTYKYLFLCKLIGYINGTICTV